MTAHSVFAAYAGRMIALPRALAAGQNSRTGPATLPIRLSSLFSRSAAYFSGVLLFAPIHLRAPCAKKPAPLLSSGCEATPRSLWAGIQAG